MLQITSCSILKPTIEYYKCQMLVDNIVKMQRINQIQSSIFLCKGKNVCVCVGESFVSVCKMLRFINSVALITNLTWLLHKRRRPGNAAPVRNSGNRPQRNAKHDGVVVVVVVIVYTNPLTHLHTHTHSHRLTSQAFSLTACN